MLRRFAELERRRARSRCSASSPTRPGSGWPSRACRASEQTVGYQVDVRYHGQGFEIPVDVDRPARRPDAGSPLGERFDAEHNRLFSFLLDVDHEIVNARATVTGPKPDVAPVTLAEGDGDPSGARVQEHEIYVGGEHVTSPVAFGGAGPLHANALGKLTGAWPVIVPPSPGRALRPRRRHHQPPRRVGPHGAAPVRRPRAATTWSRSCASSPTTPGSGWPTRACRATSRRWSTRSTSATTGRASRSRSTVDIDWLDDPDGGVRRAGRGLRRRARPAVLLPARRRPRAGQRPGHGHRPAPRRRAGRRSSRATATRPPRAVTEHPI